MRVCLASLGGALCPAPIRWVDPCGSGRFVIQHFNVADQVADVFYTIEIRIRDFHGGEGLLFNLFKRQQVGECHDAPPLVRMRCYATKQSARQCGAVSKL
jgi:hypothetical protein